MVTTYLVAPWAILLATSNAHLILEQQSALTWGPCNYTFLPSVPSPPNLDCATLPVPLDYQDEESERIQLHLSRIKAATTPSKGSVLFNPGGPGAPGADSLVGYAAHLLQYTGGEYDIIAFDPRGTGKTIPFSCLSYNVTNPPSTEKIPLIEGRGPIPERNMTVHLTTSAWQDSEDLAKACAADHPKYGRYISTPLVARDMLSIVEALNQDGLVHYYGTSYGTFLGQVFATMFPDKVGRMVLDGNIDINDYMSGIWPMSMIDSDKTFDKFLSECLAAPSLCSIANATGPGTTVDSLKSAIGEAFEELYKSQRTMIGAIGALTYQSGMVPALLYDHIKRDVWQRLYMPQRYAGAADMLALLLARNFSIYETPPASTAPAEHAELPYNEGRLSFWGITCSDTSFKTSKIEDMFEGVRQQQAATAFADVYAPQLWSCPRWKLEPAERFDGKIKGTTKTPILFVNSEYDPITPMRSAETSSARFAGSALLRTNALGHGAFAHPSTCALTAIQNYFSNGTLPDPKEVCAPDMGAFEYGEAFRAARAGAAGNGSTGSNSTTPAQVTTSGSSAVQTPMFVAALFAGLAMALSWL